MLDSFPFSVFLGCVFGSLAGIGVGGGSLLVLWLTVVLNIAPEAARSINLLFFLPSALISCFFRWKQGVLDVKAVLPAILAGCASAALFSWLSAILDTGLLKRMYGCLLVITGLRELFYRQKKAS